MEGDGDTEATGREKLMPNQTQRPHLLLMPKLSHGTTAPRLIPKLTGMAPMAVGGEDGEDTDTAPMATDTAATDTGGGELPKTDVLEPTNDCFQNNTRDRPSVTLVA